MDRDQRAKLADFAGSSIDGSPLLIAVPATLEYPGPLLSSQGDHFAFGSVLHKTMTGHKRQKRSEELHVKSVFPRTIFLGACGQVPRSRRDEYVDRKGVDRTRSI